MTRVYVRIADYHAASLACDAELQLSRAVAAAANCTLADVSRLCDAAAAADDDDAVCSEEDGDKGALCSIVTLCVLLPPRSSSTVLQSASTWTRSAQDAFARLVDRALTRVHPPLDPLQYIHATSPQFTAVVADDEDGAVVCGNDKVATSRLQPAVWLRVRPTELFARSALLLPLLPYTRTGADKMAATQTTTRCALSAAYACHSVEGVVAAPATLLPLLAVTDDHAVVSTTTTTTTMTSTTVVAASCRTDADDHDDTDGLWRRVRAAAAAATTSNTRRSSDAGASSSLCAHNGGSDTAHDDNNDDNAGTTRAAPRHDDDDDDVAEAEAALRWRLARWVAERVVNDAAWAARAQRLRPAASSSTTTSAPDTRERACVLDVAVAAARRGGGERVMHGDVRGVEVRARVVAYTPRYAYVAVPHHTSTRLTSSSSSTRTACAALLCRIPHPSWLLTRLRQQELQAHGGGSGGSGSDDDAGDDARRVTRKRARHTTTATTSTTMAEDNGNSSRSSGSGNAMCMHHVTEALWGDTSARELTPLPRAAQMPVTVRAHRVCCQRIHDTSTRACHDNTEDGGVADAHNVMVWLEDVYVTSSSSSSHKSTRDDDDGSDSYDDVVALVRCSCARYTRACERYTSVSHARSSSKSNNKDSTHDTAQHGLYARAQQLYDALVDTTAVRFTRTLACGGGTSRARQRRRSRTAQRRGEGGGVYATLPCAVPLVQTSRDAAALRECCTAELKYTLTPHSSNNTHDNNDDDYVRGNKTASVAAAGVVAVQPQRQQRRAIMDVERLRHTLAGMASMHGGVVVVGVSDAGVVVGHAPGLVTTHLRTTGFCPAMVKDSVTVREVRVLSSLCSASGDGGSGAVVRMPAEWWKRSVAVCNARSSSNSNNSNVRDDKDGGSGGERVVTVITVSRGQAPCYASARHTLPYVRTLASTTPMPMLVLARRVCEALALHTNTNAHRD